MTTTARDALHAAIQANDASAVRTVLRDHPDAAAAINGALPHGPFGQTALLAAVKQRNLEIVDLLLGAGADINAGSHWWAGGFTVLDETDAAFLPALLERGARMTPHAAARFGLLDRLRAMVDADPAAVHAHGGDGQLPLHFASSVEIVDFLLSRGADVDATDVDHESTAAQWMLGDVVDGGYPRTRRDITRYLVSRGCRTDILMAAAIGDADRVRAHLDADPAAIRTRVTERWFPMKDSRAGGTIYIWTLGAYLSAPLVAKKFGHDDVFALLMDRSPADMKLAVACALGDEASVRSLLASRPTLARELAEDDVRLIADAAETNRTDAVRLMLEAGWPADARGKHGATALHWAGFHGNAAMARELVRRGAPLDARTTEFEGTPLEWTLYGSRHGWRATTGDYAATVEALLDAGAKVPEQLGEPSDAVRDVLRAREYPRRTPG
jgi:ankyrin repeat protein